MNVATSETSWCPDGPIGGARPRRANDSCSPDEEIAVSFLGYLWDWTCKDTAGKVGTSAPV